MKVVSHPVASNGSFLSFVGGTLEQWSWQSSESWLHFTGVVGNIFLMCKLGIIYRVVKIQWEPTKCLINVNFFFSP